MNADEKRALLRRILTERAAGVGDYGLSHGQRALWFLQRLIPDACAYNVAFSARLTPRLDLDAFRKALDFLVARHPALRTVFPDVGGQPLQRVLPPSSARLNVVDMTGASEHDVYAAVCADYQRPFSLDESLFVTSVYRRDREDVLLFSVHHLVFDAWSVQVLFEELRTLYESQLGGGRGVELPPLRAQYRDFVAWQSEMLGAARGTELLEYWSAVLADHPRPLGVPSSFPRPEGPILRGTHLRFALSAGASTAVHTLARQQNTTLYTVALAAMQVMLHQFSGERDITIGTPVSLRMRSEWSHVIGYFINTVPVRGTIVPEESFAAHLARVREAVLGALSHQEYPFSLMVDRIRMQRTLNRSPVFQAMLNVPVSVRGSELSALFRADSRESVRFGQSCLSSFVIPQQEGQFEIAIELAEAEGVLHGSLKYQTDLFTHDLAERMAGAFVAVLEAAAVAPETKVDALARLDRDMFEL